MLFVRCKKYVPLHKIEEIREYDGENDRVYTAEEGYTPYRGSWCLSLEDIDMRTKEIAEWKE